MQRDIVLFPGCMIQYRLSFIEVTIRKVLAYFGILFSESSQFSCCPEPNGVKNINSLIYHLTASRNLAIAENLNRDILTPCNGCFETLKGVRSEIKCNNHFRDELNSYLQKIGLHVDGTSNVYHMIEFFDKLGRSTIQEAVIYPLNSLRVAVHYGCHFIRPSNKVQMDNPLEPRIFDKLIEDLGAKSIDYNNKTDCCGGSLKRADRYELGLEMINQKLKSMKELNIDLIVVCCPECFIQFDHSQQELKKLNYNYSIPVLYYSELLCIALGINIRDLIKKYHRTPIDSIFAKIDSIHEKNELIKQSFNLDFLTKCYSCSACDNDCPVAKISPFKPSLIIEKLLRGEIEVAIKDPSIWMCLDCYLCYEYCPMRVGLVEIFTILRNLASNQGYKSKGFDNEFTSFQKNGLIVMLSKSARSRVGLYSKEPELEDLKYLISIVENQDGEIKS
jgi:heterodisulfide reductase subunit B/heterodisulfide reductase subunit C